MQKTLTLLADRQKLVARLCLGCATISSLAKIAIGDFGKFCSVKAASMLPNAGGCIYWCWFEGIRMESMDTAQLKSTVKKLDEFFRRIRNKWKAKYFVKRDKSILLANKVRAIQKSR